MELNQLTIKEAADKLAAGETTSVELTRACLARIKEVDGRIKACLTVCEAEAISAAEEADKRRKKGGGGRLLGIPFLAKDNIMTQGIKTTAASRSLENYVAPFDAAIIAKLKKAGAVLLGKTNLDEFAHGGSTENSAFGPTHNPHDLTRVPGGSSGGSAAAVAADMCIFALGTDTGGSVRHPAAFCGVVGLKPTYGRCSRFGLIAMTSSTDVPGPITKTAGDAAIVLSFLAGRDERDATTLDAPVSDYEAESSGSIKGVKIGLPAEYFIPHDKSAGQANKIEAGVRAAIEAAIEKLKELGAEFKPVNLPHTRYGVAVYYIITPSEISSNLARFDGLRYGFSDSTAKNMAEAYLRNRGGGFGAEVKRRIMLGTYALSAGYYDAYYLRAQKVRTVITREIDTVLREVDCLLTPVSPHTAFKIGEKNNDPLAMYLEDMFIVNASLAGVPALSIPAGFSNGLPVGMQLIGKRLDEAALFGIARAFQEVTDWHKKRAEI